MTTIHTFYPTHNFRPAAVTLAQDLAGAAWESYNQLLDKVCNQDKITQADRVSLQVSLQDARNAEQNYRNVYDAWQAQGGMSV